MKNIPGAVAGGPVILTRHERILVNSIAPRIMAKALNHTEIVASQQAVKAEPQQWAARLALINEIGGQIAAVLELDEVLERATRLVQAAFEYHHVALFMVEGDELRLRSIAGSYEDYFPPGHIQQLNEGLNAWVATHGEKVLANDVSTEPRYISPIPNHTVTQAELCLPIKVGGQTLGVFDIQN